MSDEQTETSALTRERGEAVQRVKELEEEVAIGGKLIDERDRVLDLLPCEKHGRCVPHAIEAIEQLQATLAARDRRIEQARVQLSGCLVAAEGGTKDNAKQGDYGWSVAYQATLDLRVRYDSAVQEAGRLREVLDEFFHYGYDRNKCDKALKGQH